MKKPSRGCIWTLGIICVAVLTLVALDKFLPTKAIRELPDGASNIREHLENVGTTGDHTRLMKARIPVDEVAEYARRVGATSREAGGAGRDYFSWSLGHSWFSPKKPPIFFHYQPGYRILVGWEDGYVYYDAVEW